jgi:hypothetical protein
LALLFAVPPLPYKGAASAAFQIGRLSNAAGQ